MGHCVGKYLVVLVAINRPKNPNNYREILILKESTVKVKNLAFKNLNVIGMREMLVKSALEQLHLEVQMATRPLSNCGKTVENDSFLKSYICQICN